MPEAMESYDVVVVGTGQGGAPLARAFAEAGKRTAIIEREDVGGTCVNTGCTPTKTMVASARIAHLAGRAADYGVETGVLEVNFPKVRQRKRAIVESWRQGSEKRLESTPNLTLLRGEASFLSRQTLRVRLLAGGEVTLQASTIVLNTGVRTQLPDIQGIQGVAVLDNRSIMELERVPRHLLVLGGGYIGIEFAQMFRRFGAEVTVVQHGPQVLEHEDPDVAAAVAQILEEDGIRVLLNQQPLAVSVAEGIVLRMKGPEGEHTRVGSHLLVATGRQPNTDALNLAAAGVETDSRGFIRVNEALETSIPHIYAIGDVKGGPAFTHISYDDFRVLRENLLEGGNRHITGRILPYTVFIDPQLGRVGLSETEAHAQGKSIRIARLPMAHVARAIEMDETRGFMKVIVDGETDQILGASILGIEGGEIASILQVAMMGGLPYTALRDGVFSHPTLAESLNNLFTNLEAA